MVRFLQAGGRVPCLFFLALQRILWYDMGWPKEKKGVGRYISKHLSQILNFENTSRKDNIYIMSKSVIPDFPDWPRQLDPQNYLPEDHRNFIDYHLIHNNASEAYRLTYPSDASHLETKQVGRRAARLRKKLRQHIERRRLQLRNYYTEVSDQSIKRDLLDTRDRLHAEIANADSSAAKAKLYTELNKTLRALGETQGAFVSRHESTHTTQTVDRKDIEERLAALTKKAGNVVPLKK